MERSSLSSRPVTAPSLALDDRHGTRADRAASGMKHLALLCLLVVPVVAQAQTQGANTHHSESTINPRPDPGLSMHRTGFDERTLREKMAPADQDAEMTRAALQAAQLVDANRTGELWDGASSVARNAVTREAFVSQITAERGKAGALVGRGKPSVSRMRYAAGAPVPEGVYVSVAFPTRFANNPQPVRELVSFRLEDDKVLRLTGYALTPPAASPSR